MQRQLHLLTPTYLHVPVITNAKGEKPSKQNGAQPLTVTQSIQTLIKTVWLLGLETGHVASIELFWPLAISAWAVQQLIEQA
ncbi:MAG: hypothetical protein H7240_01610 [Glaciimonas sp.]|nr:hypothetical protein [Glaciimonas sp.]